jgi:tetratricopeptide (TPR) repeat protein
MKTKLYSILFITFLGVILFSSCKSVNKLYQKGDYDEAVYTAVKKMQKNKLRGDTKERVADAYAKAVLAREEQIARLLQRNDELKWEAVTEEYMALQRLSDAINRSPEALEYVKPKSFTAQLADAREQAAQTRYNRGMYWMQQTDKASARKAWYEFTAACRYRPGDAALAQQADLAYDRAVTNVVITPVAHRYFGFSDVGRGIDRDVINYLHSNSAGEFVRFYSEWEAGRDNRRIDHVVELRFDDMRRGRINRDRNEREVSKDNILLREVYVRPDSVVREYGRVTARVSRITETVNHEALFYLTVRDANTRYAILDRRIDGVYCWVNEFGSFTGDQRALSDDDLRLVNRRQNAEPGQGQIINAVTRDACNKIIQELRYLYQREF